MESSSKVNSKDISLREQYVNTSDCYLLKEASWA